MKSEARTQKPRNKAKVMAHILLYIITKKKLCRNACQILSVQRERTSSGKIWNSENRGKMRQMINGFLQRHFCWTFVCRHRYLSNSSAGVYLLQSVLSYWVTGRRVALSIFLGIFVAFCWGFRFLFVENINFMCEFYRF